MRLWLKVPLSSSGPLPPDCPTAVQPQCRTSLQLVERVQLPNPKAASPEHHRKRQCAGHHRLVEHLQYPAMHMKRVEPLQEVLSALSTVLWGVPLSPISTSDSADCSQTYCGLLSPLTLVWYMNSKGSSELLTTGQVCRHLESTWMVLFWHWNDAGGLQQRSPPPSQSHQEVETVTPQPAFLHKTWAACGQCY